MSKEHGGSAPVTGWKLDPEERRHLLARFAPLFPDVVADHVTLRRGGASLPQEDCGEIVGQVDDGRGVQALVVAIGGTTHRPDGSTYHITWSLDRAKGRRAVESNDVIARLGWLALSSPVPITLRPARF
ncbi:hypothetical protein [Sphingomonas sp.]|uniref:hypothetical protein n=1 Tax=Sphingomonas sp. TaxID=28214 RepID=UPI002FDB856C